MRVFYTLSYKNTTFFPNSNEISKIVNSETENLKGILAKNKCSDVMTDRVTNQTDKLTDGQTEHREVSL